MSDFPPNLDDGELWLPSDVLCDNVDDDFLTTESVARLMLDDGQISAMSKSPKSTLPSDSQGSSSGGSSSPATPTGSHRDAAWDLLDAAVMKLKADEVNWKPPPNLLHRHHQQQQKDMDYGYSGRPSTWASGNDEGNNFQSLQRIWNPIDGAATPNVSPQQSMQHKPCPVLSGWWQQTRPTQGRSIRIADHAYPPSVPAKGGGLGMQAIFLDSNGLGRESGGTGVFLPRRIGNGNSVDSKKKKKSACSTVLLPYRVVQALNLNIEYLNSRPTVRDLYVWKHSANNGRKQTNDNKPFTRDSLSGQQKKTFNSDDSNIQPPSPEISLPQDWTY
jgi:hypothetical protein